MPELATMPLPSPEPKKLGGFQRRINRMNKKLGGWQRKIVRLEAENAELITFVAYLLNKYEGSPK